jgi:integrase
MRWSGLRIRDAITLERSRLAGDSILLYQAKTRTPVYVPLPPDVAETLRATPPGIRSNPRYFFWSGNGHPKSAVADWQRSYRRLFELAALKTLDGTLKRCFPHMFRDTFAVEMLLAGVPLEQVSILLGHKSVKITEKHYAPWVKARQEQLEQNVRKAWGGNVTVIETGRRRPSKAAVAR